MPQTLLPVYPSDAIPINNIVPYCSRDGRAAKEFDFRAAVGFEDGLKRTIDWYKNCGRP